MAVLIATALEATVINTLGWHMVHIWGWYSGSDLAHEWIQNLALDPEFRCGPGALCWTRLIESDLIHSPRLCMLVRFDM